MPRKRHTAEEIVAKVQQLELLTSQGKTIVDAVRTIGVAEATYYCGRQEIGALKGDQPEPPLSTQSGDSSVHWAEPPHPTLCTHSI